MVIKKDVCLSYQRSLRIGKKKGGGVRVCVWEWGGEDVDDSQLDIVMGEQSLTWYNDLTS